MVRKRTLIFLSFPSWMELIIRFIHPFIYSTNICWLTAVWQELRWVLSILYEQIEQSFSSRNLEFKTRCRHKAKTHIKGCIPADYAKCYEAKVLRGTQFTMRNPRRPLWERDICCRIEACELGWWINTCEWLECRWEPAKQRGRLDGSERGEYCKISRGRSQGGSLPGGTSSYCLR